MLYNLGQLKYLRKQKKYYKKYGLKRPVFFPLHSEHFAKLPDKQVQDNWDEKGFVVLPQVFTVKEVDQLNQSVNEQLQAGNIDFNYTGRKIHFAYEHVPEIKQFMHHPKVKAVLEEKMGAKVQAFQSINFHYGSEQKAHSDSIHMSTYPQGGLIAAWVALDDVDEENGTIFYYPGSHRWPYATNQMIGASTGALLSPNPNALYEQYVQREIEDRGIEKEVFKAKKGDVLIWHGNLLHGGLPHLNMDRTRRSLVVHYFKENLICYHEISQRPAVVKGI